MASNLMYHLSCLICDDLQGRLSLMKSGNICFFKEVFNYSNLEMPTPGMGTRYITLPFPNPVEMYTSLYQECVNKTSPRTSLQISLLVSS